jgi:hypothetical protein
MSDMYLYESSLENQIELEPFVSRKVLYVVDMNQQSYNGQIIIDSSSLSNSGLYASYSEAYLEVPLVIRLSATSANAQISGIRDLQSSFAVGLKNGFHQFIHSISCEYNNTSVVQLTPFTNFYVTYKLLTSMAQEDVAKYGTSLGFFPDGSLSYTYGSAVAADPTGHGSINNKNLVQFYASVADYGLVMASSANDGYFNRQKNTSALNPTSPNVAAFTNAGLAGQVGLNYFVNQPSGNVDSKVWFVLATIRLKDVCEFFDRLPLVKGAFLRLIINYNTGVHNLALTVAGGAVADFSSTSNVITGGSSPLLVASPISGNGFGSIAAACITAAAGATATYNFQTTMSVARDTTINVSHPTLQQTRLYVPVYQMNPVNEEQYLTLSKIKTVRYKDIYQYQIEVNTSSGVGNFNSLLTNGIPNPKSIIIIPFASASANPTSVAGNYIAPFSSPFASEPGTTTPLIQFTSFNVQVSGVNIFTSNELYNFENFLNELSHINAINGGQTDGLNSGLIGFEQFINNYRYYVCDISRRLPSEDRVPKSLQILGTILSTLPSVTLYCFIEFEKEIAIDLETGAKLS